MVLIISWATCALSWAAEAPQFSLGDKLSVFSDKAYRKNNGRYFEAVGNVVIISQKDTVYGELASLDQETMLVRLEGNVRFITKDMTLYGSHVEYNIATGTAVIKNARILTSTFNLVANELIRVSENQYIANEAEFTTCKDCAESWAVFGKEIRVDVGKYVTIRHGLAKIKGVDVIYLPYIVIPIAGKRKSGLLFPNFSSRAREGFAFEQPVFWAISDSKDATLSPTFWAKRGYGGDVQYRQRFGELKWFEGNMRLLNDTIYEPGKSSQSLSGDEFFRYFTELESHFTWNPNLNSHFRYTGTRDLDMILDHNMYTDPKNISSDFGFSGFTDWRSNAVSVSVEANYLRNQLFDDPMEFDRQYVQVMPRVGFSTVPLSVVQSDKPLLRHLALGVDGSVTRFRQVDDEEDVVLRNADRLSTQPYVMWHLFTKGPVSLKSRYTFDQQMYHFQDNEEHSYGKNAGLMKTEVSFTMDKIFGLAYEEKIPIKYIPEADLKELREKKEQGLAPIQKSEKSNRLIGTMPEFEAELASDTIAQVRNSYRHSQEFKLIHHYIASQNQFGNQRFQRQISNASSTTNFGWFDYEDAKRSEEFLYGANTTRTQVSPINTAEFQWNNTLIRKKPKGFSYLDDDKYLRDNFSYDKIGYFNVSQGVLLQREEWESFEQQLTRLMLNTGYNANRWRVALQEFYFHYEKENIFTTNFNRSFDYFNILGAYNYNSFGQSNLHSLNLGGQVRPTDVLGFAVVRNFDLHKNENIRTDYSLDIMPNNNCWILSLNYSKSLVATRYFFNIMFNFGDDNFSNYRNNYFGVKRL